MKKLMILFLCLILMGCSDYQGEADGTVDCSKKDPDAVFDSPYTCFYGQARDTKNLALCDEIMKYKPVTSGWAACVGTVSAMVKDEEACARMINVDRWMELSPKTFERKWNPSMTEEKIAKAKADIRKNAERNIKSDIRHCIAKHWEEKEGTGEVPGDFLGYDSYK